MINKVTLIGRLTREIDSGATANGISYARFSLAVQRSFANQQGVREADFINCVAWRNAADIITKYVKKGDLFAVSGKLQSGSYQDSNGNTRYTTDVLVEDFQFIGGNNNTQNTNNNNGNFNQGQGFNNQTNQSFNNQPTQNNFNNQANTASNNTSQSEADLLNDFESGFNLDDDVPF